MRRRATVSTTAAAAASAAVVLVGRAANGHSHESRGYFSHARSRAAVTGLLPVGRNTLPPGSRWVPGVGIVRSPGGSQQQQPHREGATPRTPGGFSATAVAADDFVVGEAAGAAVAKSMSAHREQLKREAAKHVNRGASADDIDDDDAPQIPRLEDDEFEPVLAAAAAVTAPPEDLEPLFFGAGAPVSTSSLPRQANGKSISGDTPRPLSSTEVDEHEQQQQQQQQHDGRVIEEDHPDTVASYSELRRLRLRAARAKREKKHLLRDDDQPAAEYNDNHRAAPVVKDADQPWASHSHGDVRSTAESRGENASPACHLAQAAVAMSKAKTTTAAAGHAVKNPLLWVCSQHHAESKRRAEKAVGEQSSAKQRVGDAEHAENSDQHYSSTAPSGAAFSTVLKEIHEDRRNDLLDALFHTMMDFHAEHGDVAEWKRTVVAAAMTAASRGHFRDALAIIEAACAAWPDLLLSPTIKTTTTPVEAAPPSPSPPAAEPAEVDATSLFDLLDDEPSTATTVARVSNAVTDRTALPSAEPSTAHATAPANDNNEVGDDHASSEWRADLRRMEYAILREAALRGNVAVTMQCADFFRDSAGLQPNRSVYNWVLSACSMAARREALSASSNSQQRSLEDEEHDDSRRAVSSAALETAMRVLSQMMDDDVRPASAAAVAEQIQEGAPRNLEAEETPQDAAMLRRTMPNAFSFDFAIRAATRLSDVKAAVSLLELSIVHQGQRDAARQLAKKEQEGLDGSNSGSANRFACTAPDDERIGAFDENTDQIATDDSMLRVVRSLLKLAPQDADARTAVLHLLSPTVKALGDANFGRPLFEAWSDFMAMNNNTTTSNHNVDPPSSDLTPDLARLVRVVAERDVRISPSWDLFAVIFHAVAAAIAAYSTNAKVPTTRRSSTESLEGVLGELLSRLVAVETAFTEATMRAHDSDNASGVLQARQLQRRRLALEEAMTAVNTLAERFPPLQMADGGNTAAAASSNSDVTPSTVGGVRIAELAAAIARGGALSRSTTPLVLSSAMYHATTAGRWAESLALHAELPVLAPSATPLGALSSELTADALAAGVAGYAVYRGHDEAVVRDVKDPSAAHERWASLIARATDLPRLAARGPRSRRGGPTTATRGVAHPQALDTPARVNQVQQAVVLQQFFGGYTAGLMLQQEEDSHDSGKDINNVLVDRVDQLAASYPFAEWRSDSLAAYLATLHAAGRHGAVVAAFHRVNDAVKEYTEWCLHRACGGAGAVQDGADDGERGNGRQARGAGRNVSERGRHLSISTRRLSGGNGNGDGSKAGRHHRVTDRASSRPSSSAAAAAVPHVAMTSAALAVVVDACAAAGKWRLAVAAVEQMANVVSFEGGTPSSSSLTGGDDFGDVPSGDDVENERVRDLNASLQKVKALCVRHGYLPSEWREPERIP